VRPFILIAVIVYTIGLLVGFQIDPVLAQRVDTGSFTVWDIARNNLASVFVNIAGGLSLGVISVLNTAYNGLILGYAVSIVLEHTSSTDFVRHFLPHSIEIVAIILSCALGLYIARFIWRTLLKSQDTKFQKRTFIACLALSVIIVLVAAFLEVNVSMR